MVDRNDQSDSPLPAHDLSGVRVALAHDWVVTRRGGELVLEAIAEHLLRAGARVTHLYTLARSRRAAGPAIDALSARVSSIGRLPERARRWALPLYPRAVGQLSRRLAHDHEHEPIHLLISTSSSAIKNIAPPPGVPHLCYCHAPARYLWDQRDAYALGDTASDRLRTLGLERFGPALRAWDRSGAETVTAFVANSHHIARAIRENYGRDSVVIHPPVRTDLFTPDERPRGGRLLVAGAIEPYKRVELAILAARSIGAPIDIVGDGSAARALRRRLPQSPDRRWLGRIDDRSLLERFRSARALIQPQVEDFGITALEAQSCGCPVVARRAGGALETVRESITGVFFDDPDPASIAHAIGRLGGASIDPRACRANALRFSRAAFDAKLGAVIAGTLGGQA